jgi:four helix bundle protein
MNARDCTLVLSDFVIRHSFGFRHSSFVIFLRLIEQLVGAGTSVGANYCEADDGVSRKDFKNKIGTCRKEARETKFFLRMIATAEPSLKSEARILWQEAKELHLIFSKIWRK